MSRAVPGNPGVVDQNIHPPRLGQDLLRTRLDARGIGHVGRASPRRRPQTADFRGRFFHVFQAQVDTGNPGPGAREFQRNRPANSPARTGYHGHLLIQ